ncbi:MAG: DoxX family protein [Bacteroidota bacterium]|nr:DoxX family protein [Bacteroidota bacterium]
MSVPNSALAAAPAPHPLRTLTRVCWFLLGALFIFSGLIKLNDPVGTAYKLEEYFEVFAASVPSLAGFFLWFKGSARTLSILLSSGEVILGAALLLRWHLRITLWALFAMLVFFAFLTFYSAAFNKVTDCGCFGDFIKLTPWTSFIKDVFLLILWAVIFTHQRFLRHSFVQGMLGIMTMTFVSAIAIGIGVRALGHMPYFDFLPYKVGNDIGKLMKARAPLRYEYEMEKNGKTETFTTYPDSTWTYKSMTALNPDDGPKITDFKVWNDEGDYTPELLRGYKLVLVVQDVEKADRDRYDQINKLLDDAKTSHLNITPLIITSSSPAEFDVFRHSANLAVPFYYADATVLKSMIRSNPGFVLLKDGVVKGKYHYHDIPSIGKVEEKLQ